jgi:haloacetate dehalogenase
VDRCFRPLDEWRRLAPNVNGGPLPIGHFIAEEVPDQLLGEVIPFFESED